MKYPELGLEGTCAVLNVGGDVGCDVGLDVGVDVGDEDCVGVLDGFEVGSELGVADGEYDGVYDGAADGAPVIRKGSTSVNNVVVEPCILICTSCCCCDCDVLTATTAAAVLFRTGFGTRGIPSFCNAVGSIASIHVRDDVVRRYWMSKRRRN